MNMQHTDGLQDSPWWPQIAQLHTSLYHDPSWLKRLQGVLEQASAERSLELQEQDRLGATWYQSNTTAAYTLYVDLFAGSFEGIHQRIPYLKELGINLVHFMPLLKSREGQTDGGYAVADYQDTDPRLGTMEAFEQLLAHMRHEGIATCIDFVVNHTAKEHPWALAARNGDPEALGMYLSYPTDEIPRQFDATVPQVFPRVAPGNFTWYEDMQRWVFTSFYEFQWDLDYHNPLVFERMCEILLFMANKGVKMIRLDAIPFMWKELGTTCRNLPPIHTILQLFQTITRMVCPSVVLLGEAIVEPREIVGYFGKTKPECEVMYNATGMVSLWNSLATRETSLLYAETNRFSVPPWAVWINYARCHDDIGWGFNEAAVRSMGFDPHAHKQFLINFYQGTFPGSFSTGELYEFDPQTLDARNSGTLASLCGLEKALASADPWLISLAINRIKLVHSIVLAGRGIPLIYQGDELGTLNYWNYKDKADHCHDSRWLHRVPMDWSKAQRRSDPTSPEGDIFSSIKTKLAIRKSNTLFDSRVPLLAIQTGNPHLYAHLRSDGIQYILCIFNLTETPQGFSPRDCEPGVPELTYTDLVSKKILDWASPSPTMNPTLSLTLEPYESLWLYGSYDPTGENDQGGPSWQ